MGTQPYDHAAVYQKACDDTAKFLRENPSWVLGGVVLVDTDTANMTIFADGKERMLITPERNELMDPKRPCFQTSIEKLSEQLRQGGHD